MKPRSPNPNLAFAESLQDYLSRYARIIKVSMELMPAKFVNDIVQYRRKRIELEWYLIRCEERGFAKTHDALLLCARRWMAGKRKINPPGTRARKESAKATRKLLSNMPAELLTALDTACSSPAAQEYASGKGKALNAVVGLLLRQYPIDAATARQIIMKRLRP